MGANVRILVSGSTGLIGSALVAARRAAGDDVVRLVRSGGPDGGVRWNAAGAVDPGDVGGFDAVVHLAGEPVAGGRWTAARKQRIRDSRVVGTRRLAEALTASDEPPKVFLCASGINFYGDGGDRVLDEEAPGGRGFLAEVTREWESAAALLHGVARVVSLRIGVVLSPEGGTLAAMLPLFRMGLAGPIGGGRAYVSWVTLEDVVRAIGHAVASEGMRGPVNVVAPEPVRGVDFIAAVAAAVGRPARIPVPAWLARLTLGEMAEETVLASIRAVPRRLLEDGFSFEAGTLPSALARWNLGEGKGKLEAGD